MVYYESWEISFFGLKETSYSFTRKNTYWTFLHILKKTNFDSLVQNPNNKPKIIEMPTVFALITRPNRTGKQRPPNKIVTWWCSYYFCLGVWAVRWHSHCFSMHVIPANIIAIKQRIKPSKTSWNEKLLAWIC